MKYMVELAVLISLLLLSIGVSLLNVGTILPYSSHKEYHSYEGFKEGGTSDQPDDTIPLNLKEAPGVENPSEYEDTSVITKNKNTELNKNTEVKTDKNVKPIDKTTNKKVTFQDNDDATESEPFTKKEGMTPMIYPSPSSTNTSLDMYSLERGSHSCIPSPYSNSQGYLCMTPEQVKLLNTRGGNQTGGSELNVSPA